MMEGSIVVLFFDGLFADMLTDSCKETEIDLVSFGVEETIGERSECWSNSETSANPNGILDVIKNEIVIREKTDFSLELPNTKHCKNFLM